MAISPESKMASPDRTLVLKVIDGTLPKTSTGLTDSRLLTGENNLRLVKEPQTSFWFFKQNSGGVPPALKMKFTSFNAALKFARDYYKTRNIEITEVIN